MSFKGQLGRKPPYSPEEKPRLVLEDYLDMSALPTAPNVIDYSTRIGKDSWGMMMNGPDPQAPAQIRNTGIGDCTFAEAGHDTMAQTLYGTGTMVTLPDSSLLKGYETVGGYVLGDPSTDNGCVIQDVLNYRRKTGLADSAGNMHKISAFAQVSSVVGRNTDWNVLKQALYLFGSVDIGVNFPDSAMDQFNNGEPWSVVNGSPIDGGHCVTVQRWDQTVPNGYVKVVTWGQEQAVRTSWWTEYVEEAWVIITPDWLNSMGESPTGLNMAQLQADLTALTSE